MGAYPSKYFWIESQPCHFVASQCPCDTAGSIQFWAPRSEAGRVNTVQFSSLSCRVRRVQEHLS